MKRFQCIVAFGANLGDREATFLRVLEKVSDQIGSIQKRSKLYETEALLHPENPEPQPNFLNAVFIVSTALEPKEVLSKLLAMEEEQGRDRQSVDKPWAPRVVDLDLIAYDSVVLESAELTLPHKHMHQRDFVLIPLKEIAPEWIHPKRGMTAEQMLAMLTDRYVL